jgi:hypothetical protein
MAIDRIPGVGPQNSDIATAVAAPSIGTITTAITTNAASAGVTMAAITSSITTNAASAGVTLAAIGTQVANNSPSPNNWTLVGTIALSGTTQTFSSLSGYKTYRLMIAKASTNNSGIGVLVRFNSDTTAGNYPYLFQASPAVANSYTFVGTTSTTAFNPNGLSTSIDISNANVASPKRIGNGFNAANSGTVTGTAIIESLWLGTAAVNSISVIADSASTFTQGTLYLLGAN